VTLTVRLARSGDADALARLAAACPMEGLLTVASVPGDRAPAWEQFAGPRDIWVAEDAHAIVGSVSLAQRHTRLDGCLTRWGYLGELRVLPDARRRGVALALTRAGVVAERDAQSCFTALATLGGNRAMEALIDRCRDLPHVVPFARMRLIQWLTLRAPARPMVATRPARAADLPDMHRLLARSWDERALGPALDLDGFAAEWGHDASLSLEDAVVAERNGAIVGCGTLWDQRALRQEVVVRYRFPLSAVVRGIRWYAAWRGGPTLPPTGQPLPLAAIRFFGATDLAAAVAVRDALLGMARRRGVLIVMLGLDARDPLAPVARGYWHVSLPATLWVGQATRRMPDLSPLLGRPAYVDFSLV
jgi:predicted N-acetyltransferase YhbS